MGRVVDHQRLRVDALEEMGRGDVAHVEGRVLAEQHHVEGREVGGLGVAEREVVALDVADRRPARPAPRRGRRAATAGRACSGRARWPRRAASSISAKVELPRMLRREMWSIWTATVSGMCGVSPDVWPGAISGPAAPKAMPAAARRHHGRPSLSKAAARCRGGRPGTAIITSKRRSKSDGGRMGGEPVLGGPDDAPRGRRAAPPRAPPPRSAGA